MGRGLPALLCLLLGCAPRAPRQVDIIATDYAFQAPATLPAGPTDFHFLNRGKQFHEVQLFRWKAGISPDSALRLATLDGDSLPDGARDSSLVILVAQPGAVMAAKARLDLRPGEVWALRCNFRDAKDAPRHRAMGMVAALSVTASEAR